MNDIFYFMKMYDLVNYGIYNSLIVTNNNRKGNILKCNYNEESFHNYQHFRFNTNKHVKHL